MSAGLEKFLDQQLPRPGIVACAIRLPDHSVVCRRDGDALTTAQVEQALSRLALAAEGLKRHRVEVQTLCWTFERARIHLSHRADGAVIAVFSENQAGQPPNEGALHLLRVFAESAEG